MLKRPSAASVVSFVCLVMVVAMVPVGLLAQKASSEVDRDQAELRQYRLTMPKIRQWAAATLAFGKQVEKDPALAEKIKNGDEPEPKTLADFAARINKEPRLAAAIAATSLSPREYATITLCYIPTMMAYGMKKQGVIKELPKEIPAENVALIEANEAELTRLNQELQAHDINKSRDDK